MYTQRRFSLVNLISFIVFLAFLVYGGYNYVSKVSLENSIADTDVDISNLEEQVSQLEAQGLDEATIARKVISAAEENEVVWSEVVGNLLEVTPFDVYYSSYGGTESGYVTVNALADSYYAVAGLIDVLVSEAKFKEVFVPSVSSLSDEDMVSFSFGFTYDDAKTAR